MLTNSVSRGEGITLADLQNAFLNAELSSEDGTIAIRLPKSWQRNSQPFAILRKAMYGLKISPRRWFDAINSKLVELGWDPVGENGLYTKMVDSTKLWLTLYVDDIIVGGGSETLRRSELDKIFKEYPGKILEPVVQKDGTKVYDVNGMTLEIKGSSYLIHMQPYIQKLLKKFNLDDASPVTHPKVNTDLILKQAAPSSFPVREALGGLIWLSTTARPDITYDVGLLSRYVGKYGATAGTANACKKILKFLAGSQRRGLRYSPQREKEFCDRYSKIIAEQCGGSSYGTSTQSESEFSGKVYCFSDASFATCPLTLRSQTGICVYFKGALIAYKSMRQTIITHSTCESEYCAASDALTFLRSLEDTIHMFDPPLIPGQEQPLIPLFSDNQSAIRVARAKVLGTASKHLKLRWMKVTEQEKRLFFCTTTEQEADALTKSIGQSIFGMLAIEE